MGLSLAKNESISLKKSDGGALKSVTIGLGWDAAGSSNSTTAKKGLFGRLKQSVASVTSSIDLDASIIQLDNNDATGAKVVEIVSYSNLKSNDGSIKHSGDNLTGDGDGDDEQIVVDLSKVSPGVKHLAVVITSYRGHTFDQVENVFCRMVDNSTNLEVVRYDLRESGKNTGQVMAILTRSGDGWTFKATGIPVEVAKNAKDLVPAIVAELRRP